MEKFCDDLISIQFLGPDQDIDFMMKKVFGGTSFTGRAFVLYQWLLVLQKTSWAGYMNDPDIDDLIPGLQDTLTI